MEEAKFIQAMKDYQAGARKHKKMEKAATGLSDADIAEFRAIIEDTGALSGTKEKAAELIREGKAALEAMKDDIDPRTYDFLSSVSEYMMNREY